jgi:hypothetical protein
MSNFKQGVEGLIGILWPWVVFILFVTFMGILPSCFGPLEHLM